MSKSTTTTPATCHPEREARGGGGGLCTWCHYDATHPADAKELNRRMRRRRFNEPYVATPEPLPERITKVEHRALTRLPPVCPKCSNQFLRVEGRRVSCYGGCGWDSYVVADDR